MGLTKKEIILNLICILLSILLMAWFTPIKQKMFEKQNQAYELTKQSEAVILKEDIIESTRLLYSHHRSNEYSTYPKPKGTYVKVSLTPKEQEQIESLIFKLTNSSSTDIEKMAIVYNKEHPDLLPRLARKYKQSLPENFASYELFSTLEYPELNSCIQIFQEVNDLLGGESCFEQDMLASMFVGGGK